MSLHRKRRCDSALNYLSVLCASDGVAQRLRHSLVDLALLFVGNVDISGFVEHLWHPVVNLSDLKSQQSLSSFRQQKTSKFRHYLVQFQVNAWTFLWESIFVVAFSGRTVAQTVDLEAAVFSVRSAASEGALRVNVLLVLVVNIFCLELKRLVCSEASAEGSSYH